MKRREFIKTSAVAAGTVVKAGGKKPGLFADH